MSEEKVIFARHAFEARAISYGDLLEIEDGGESYLFDSFYQAHKYLIGELSAKLTAERDELLANKLPEDYIAVPESAWHMLVQCEVERDAALTQNAELVAKINAIKDAWLAAGSWPDTVEEKQTISNAINATPSQCLREVQAEAGRAGFVAGADNYFDRHYDKAVSDEVLAAADQYAEKVRSGNQ